MQVGAGGGTCAAHEGDFLPSPDGFPLLNQKPAAMGLQRGETIPVIQNHIASITVPLTGKAHRAA